MSKEKNLNQYAIYTENELKRYGYAMMLGRTNNDSYNFLMAKCYETSDDARS